MRKNQALKGCPRNDMNYMHQHSGIGDDFTEDFENNKNEEVGADLAKDVENNQNVEASALVSNNGSENSAEKGNQVVLTNALLKTLLRRQECATTDRSQRLKLNPAFILTHIDRTLAARTLEAAGDSLHLSPSSSPTTRSSSPPPRLVSVTASTILSSDCFVCGGCLIELLVLQRLAPPPRLVSITTSLLLSNSSSPCLWPASSPSPAIEHKLRL